MGTGATVCIFDATETRWGLSIPWRAGSVILGFDDVIEAKSWEDAIGALRTYPDDSVREVQFWGHGTPGRVYINHKQLDVNDLAPLARVMASPSSLWWWRTCSSFAGVGGHAFAQRCVSVLGCRVASSTHRIGLLHSGQHSLRPGDRPQWATSEGNERKDRPYTDSSAPWAPHTIPCFTKKLPDAW